MISELSELGLEGGAQVHVAPTVLAIDIRAHQAFIGFGSDVESVRAAIRRRFGDHAEIWTRIDGEMHSTTLAALAPSDMIVVAAADSLHSGGVSGLRWVVDRLLGPGGCPWDQAQTHESLTRHLVEECYELVEAINDSNDAAMREELGDVLLQPVMHAQMIARDGGEDIDEIADLITEKLIRRHPHVFGDTMAETEADVLRNWDAIKKVERAGTERSSVLDGIPKSMPGLLRALEISKRAARSGFEWPDFESVWEKFHEEEGELRDALAGGDQAEIESEFGDLLFTVVNLARWAKVDPEEALRAMLDRFSLRFKRMESMTELPLSELSPLSWDELWNEAKRTVG